MHVSKFTVPSLLVYKGEGGGIGFIHSVFQIESSW
jgi:hypothetical protein